MIKNNLSPILIPVILCGGSGSRLWPLSRKSYPKPFIQLPDGKTLLEKTYGRIALLSNIPRVNGKPLVLTVTNHEYYFISKDEINKTNLFGVFLLEPEGRNTAPAISIAALWIKKNYGDNASMLILPADHIIQNEIAFIKSVEDALELNHQEPSYLVTFGIKPHTADTGLGYIESGKELSKGFEVNHFYEKPDLRTAENFVLSKLFYWNSGIFCFKVRQFLDEMAVFSPEVLSHAEASWNSCKITESVDDSVINIAKEDFQKCPDISIDYALMEKTKNIAIIPADLQWSDIGSWLSFSQLEKPDEKGNSIIGNGLIINSHNTYVRSGARLVTVLGANNLIIVDTPDALLVMDKSHTNDLKILTSKIKDDQKDLLDSHRRVKRPWGAFTILEIGPSFKIKCIEVAPLKSLSMQSHKYRSEHWVVIEGEAEVTNEDKLYRIKTNTSTYIARGAKHRLRNPLPNTTLKIIEVQSGSYLGEDDIKRFEDDFGRI